MSESNAGGDGQGVPTGELVQAAQVLRPPLLPAPKKAHSGHGLAHGLPEIGQDARVAHGEAQVGSSRVFGAA